MLKKFYELESEEREALLKLQTMVMSDHSTERIKAISLVSETRDNVDAVIDEAARIHKSSSHPPLVIFNDAKRHPAVRPSNEIWTDLINKGIPSHYIACIVLPEDGGPPINTRTEMIGVFNYISKYYPKSRIGIVAPAFHQLRSMMSIQSIQEHSNAAYAKTIDFISMPAPVNWSHVSIHNQGIHTDVRHQFIITELERCAEYHLKGDLIAPSRALEIFLAQHS